MTMKDFEECSWAAGRPYLGLGSWQGHERNFRESTYRHPEGVVEIYEQTRCRHPMTNMRFRHNGRDYIRTWRTTWGPKTQARLARELIEDSRGL